MRVVVVAGAVVITVAGLAGTGCRQLFGIDDTQIEHGDAAGGADAGDDAVGPDAGPRAVAHLRDDDVAVLALDGELVVLVDAVLDTDALTIEPTAGGAGIRVFTQDGPFAPEVVVVDASTIMVGAELRIRGSRPAIFVATTIAVTGGGAIDASADTTTAGPGGYPAEDGPGAGGRATPSGNYDPGGGGGGYGTAGAAGADEHAGTAGQGGGAYGDEPVTVLTGGSGGGSVARCPVQRPGGAGGGALQLTAFDALTIDGAVDAGGGGGSGGDVCNQSTEGAGGGAGGSIYLQARVLLGTGTVTANGGGGGGAALLGDGVAGSDGLRTASHAPGGESVGDGTGGFGGARAELPTRGTMLNLNGGGGGGAVGRIAVLVAPAPPGELTFSPAAVAIP